MRRADFWAKVDKADGCWLWTGWRNHDGYGKYRVNGKLIFAHHFTAGRSPEGMEWDHLCRNRACVNPAHLEAVKHQVNMQRGHWGSKTHCPRGHAYDVANTYTRPDGGRECRTCNRARKSRYDAEHPRLSGWARARKARVA